MDRYVIKERRPGTGSEHSQGNQMIAFSTSNTAGNNIAVPAVYYGVRGEFQGLQHMEAGLSDINMNTPHLMSSNTLHNSGQIISGIDPRYLAAYSSNNISYIAGHKMQQEKIMLPENAAFGSNYQNRNFVPVDKAIKQPYLQQRFSTGTPITEKLHFETQSYAPGGNNRNIKDMESPKKAIPTSSSTTRKQSEVNLLKNEVQSQVKTRSEKLKTLHKSGPRAFSGPVEKVLKWHKSLQDIGLLVFYEIVAKCVSVRPGERCAKNIVVRDDNGPAMQVVYYEIDFLLPELTLPCTVRVIGRMMPGTCRLQAFNVRVATGDDVATLPRRAAVASHHVAKLNKEYGKDSEKIVMILP